MKSFYKIPEFYNDYSIINFFYNLNEKDSLEDLLKGIQDSFYIDKKFYDSHKTIHLQNHALILLLIEKVKTAIHEGFKLDGEKDSNELAKKYGLDEEVIRNIFRDAILKSIDYTKYLSDYSSDIPLFDEVDLRAAYINQEENENKEETSGPLKRGLKNE